MVFHQKAADELGGDDLGGAEEEGAGQVLGERGGYGSGLESIEYFIATIYRWADLAKTFLLA